MSVSQPELQARQHIDGQLSAAGWVVQDIKSINLAAQCGVAVREFPTATGPADYMLFADGKAIGIVEAKKEGVTLSAVHMQAAEYGTAATRHIQRWADPLPFIYETTGLETLFTDEREPDARARKVFAFHRPEELLARVRQPDTLRDRLKTFPTLITAPLRDCQIDAISKLETSLADNRPRSLIQMATGSGKTYTAATTCYRLIKHAGAKRILFLVDRGNLGRQTVNEFQQFTTPDDGRKFTELYNVQMLGPAGIDPVAKVTVSTIQRLYSQLAGKEMEEDLDEHSGYELAATQADDNKEPKAISYNPQIPIEEFDFVIVDECHRSIYNLWKQVIEYFDAFLIGLTATPSKHNLGFFNQNLVTEYPHVQAVADGVNVGYDIYRIKTQITEGGSTLESGFDYKKRDRLTRTERWKLQDEAEDYTGKDLDRSVIAPDQIRTVIRTFRNKLFTDLFPSRPARAKALGYPEPWVPKTLIFAKDDNHAEEIVHLVREEFGKGNDFCQKITYRAGAKPEDLIKAFRTAPEFRIAVTVDMIATGTDIKPLECLIFMRDVRSQLYFEQMKGRGTRTIDPTDFQSVTPDGGNKTHFVLVDAVGVTESDKTDSRPLERKPTVAFDKLLLGIAMGDRDPDTLASAANRLARLDCNLTESDRQTVRELSGGLSVKQIAASLLRATDPDVIADHAAGHTDASADEVTPEALQLATDTLADEAAKPIAANPALREFLEQKRRDTEVTIDHTSSDTVLFAGYDTEKAEGLIDSWKQFIEDTKDELTALQFIYNLPHKDRHLNYSHIKQLAAAVTKPPYNIAPEEVWRAYENLEGRKPSEAPLRTLTNLITLVRHSIQPESIPLVPYAEIVDQRFAAWLDEQNSSASQDTEPARNADGSITAAEPRPSAFGTNPFSSTHLEWLHMIKDHIASSAAIEPDDFEDVPFNQKGGLAKARKLFGKDFKSVLEDLNTALVG
ncbi:type I restriction-modification enzyme R subunit C-terminal domain-containing protein [Coraliomargarita algicola]|uniref:Type I restriction-modification enzyme R subunit C-terminal domain-containing protein n=1 Tax=Coraliomargarita algicola TaxID=3092156 RepID=A0ABZ0RQZ7_9BACT|nr:DEAD/DEAH box helicase family protein [Coraliomargarita sp. J2-16]WPJ97523.1 type I restriction-modification enzyme R subunit C-terminal domain-containing protein [Coraliomargarita sp. J2-16]